MTVFADFRARRGTDRSLVHTDPPSPLDDAMGYAESHGSFVSAAMGDEALRGLLARGGRLPGGYATGFDERVVELPWLMAQRPGGRVLDAGSTLNHDHVLDRVLPEVESLCVAGLASEPQTFPERGISYVHADLRELPFRDGWFDTVCCISTIEHVGMDNSRYGDTSGRAPDPVAEQATALEELRRVVSPGGSVLLTVPYGRSEDHGWFRQFGADDLEELLDTVGPAQRELMIYAYGPDGWQVSSAEAAEELRYQDLGEDPVLPPDGAVAARGVACVRLRPGA
jgi:SAM-dependent methyltransferase